jgi:hypothetical protein
MSSLSKVVQNDFQDFLKLIFVSLKLLKGNSDEREASLQSNIGKDMSKCKPTHKITK